MRSFLGSLYSRLLLVKNGCIKVRGVGKITYCPGIAHYEQLEIDLKPIEALVGRQSLSKTYRSLLRDQNSFWNILHEIHGISLVGKLSSALELTVSLGGSSNKDFDARANILGTSVNMECTTRKDEFPFNLPPTKAPNTNIPVYSGSRAILDPHDARKLGIAYESENRNRSHIAVPEATVVRQILIEELSQLSQTGINLILVGQISGSHEDLETALFGPIVVDFVANSKMEVESTTTQLPHGAYDAGVNGDPFRSISGVLWFKLFSITGPKYKLYPNPNASSPLPREVIACLESVVA